MWQTLFRQGGLLDDAGALSHLRPTTQKMLEGHYGCWIGWLNRTDPTVLLESPAQRFTAERLSGWLEDLSRVSPVSRHILVRSALWILKLAAPDQDWSRHDHVRQWLDMNAKKKLSNRKQGRVLSSAVLLKAGLQLAGPKADMASTALKAAKCRRDGAIIAMLALMPMRRRSFIELTLGTSFEVTEREISVRLSGDMTKNGLPWEASASKVLEPVLRRYVDEVRPWFLARGAQSHDVLWVDNRGVPYVANYFGHRICQITEHLTGVRVSPHLFRDAAATTLSRTSPKDARLIPPLLAHASFGIAERHYIQASTIEAGRSYAEIMTKLLE
jgi:integrase